MSKITSFTSGATSSGFGTWHAAVLDCGHMHYAPHYGTFAGTKEIAFGKTSLEVGDSIECKECKGNAEAVARLEALDLTNIVYLRYNTRFGGRYLAYKRDETSPTGVINCDAFPAIPEIDAIIDRRHIPTMSPTEGR